MRRNKGRSLSPQAKRRHTSRDRFESLNKALTPERSQRPRSRSPSYRPRHTSPRRYEYCKPPEPTEPYYRTLCVSSLHSKASNDLIKDTLYREFRKFEPTNIKIQYESDERLAYVCFRNCEDARDAKDEISRIILYDKVAVVEKAYEIVEPSRSRHRDRSPLISPRPYYNEPPEPPGTSGYRTPYRPYAGDHYRREHQPGYHYRFPKPPTYHQGPSYAPPQHKYDNRYPPAHTPFKTYESKKDKYPDHLQHILPEDDPLATRTLFVGNLEIDIPKEELFNIFGNYGVVEDIDVKRPQVGTGNAFAFIRFQNLNMSHKAKVALSGNFIGQFQCKIGYGKAIPTPCIWVGALGSWTSVTQLERAFDRFGTIKKLAYVKGDDHAYILYEGIQAASAAVKEMRGSTLGGSEHRLRLDYSYYLCEEAKPKKFASASPYSSPVTEKSRSRSPSRSEYTEITLSEVATKCSRSWNGSFILKSCRHLANFYLIDGDADIVNNLINEETLAPEVKITQRIRLEPSQMESVREKLANAKSHATILALTDSNSVEAPRHGSIPTRPLNNLVIYFKQKRAAGVTVLTSTKSKTLLQVYSFPYCEFSAQLLRRTLPDLSGKAMEENHLVIVVVAN